MSEMADASSSDGETALDCIVDGGGEWRALSVAHVIPLTATSNKEGYGLPHFIEYDQIARGRAAFEILNVVMITIRAGGAEEHDIATGRLADEPTKRVVEIPGAEELHQLAGLVGLDAGGASLNGVLPGLGVILISQAVDENCGVGGFRSGYQFVKEILLVEGDDRRAQLREIGPQGICIDRLGHSFDFRPQRQ